MSGTSANATGLEVGQARMAARAEREAAEAAAAQAAAVEHGQAMREGDGVRISAGVTRETRKPFGTMEQKLFWPKRDGYHRHWFNDTPGRVDAALSAGYAHVQDSRAKPVSRVVGKREGGGATIAYLMEIPLEWFQEDQARSQEVVDNTYNDIHRGKAGPLGQKERYAPQRGITIKGASAQDTSR